MRARGRSLDEDAGGAHGLADEQPVLASVYAASAADVQIFGDAAGQRTLKLTQTVRAVHPAERALAEVGGVNIHAEVVVDGRDRPRLERVLRYMARPPLATERLELRDDGHVVYRFKKPWKDGASAVVLSPDDFIARLCALVPPPRFHMTRYHGVLSSHAAARAEIVPKKPPASLAAPVQLPLFGKNDEPLPSEDKTAKPSRHPWAWLLRRVFAIDILECIRCGGALRIVKVATKPDEIARALGEQTRPRGPPSTELAVIVYGQLRLRFA